MQLLSNIHNCTVCSKQLPLGAKPVLRFSAKSRIIIIGQAPGIKAHNSGIPWNDASGERLRSWLGVDASTFYDTDKFALIPMGFCYPGKGRSGDNPPRPECAPLWHPQLLAKSKSAQLKILIGNYAQAYYLGNKQKPTLTETVKAFEEYLPETIVLPHPSPRNNIWLKKNSWFEKELLPVLKHQVQQNLL
ncbi:uracil-DNA glycosylase [Lacibacter cauensis]|uniref:Uracil-DNA glycosylase n=1 Tax=Lacibacter cauensis TaxID=510947 RepID=A0A562SKN7_9BACT|nr:uracil-DNA glycosylase family protein [Lacibacter cauensis]TWI81663.1 uracil-DNA glycosylase [Lacibacter cauensis]